MEVTPIMHYLDDFLKLGTSGTLTCSHNLQVIQGVCQHLGVPLAMVKIELCTILLGTENMEACLPHDKLQCIHSQVAPG